MDKQELAANWTHYVLFLQICQYRTYGFQQYYSKPEYQIVKHWPHNPY